MSRKISRTYEKTYGIFMRIFEHTGVQTARYSDEIARKLQGSVICAEK
jgi:hypothetical protein